MTASWGYTLLAGLALCGCAEEPAAPRAISRWECPAEWVPHQLGGCGPAVVLCRPGGGAQEGACANLDLTRPRPVPYPDGGAGSTFFLLPDGAGGGAWPEPDTATVGIQSCPEPWRRLEDSTCEPVFPDSCPEGQPWPDLGTLPPDARVIHVRQGAINSPDGSEEAPYPTITRALAVLRSEAWVRVAPGTYRENLSLQESVHLVGCRHRVTLVGIDRALPTVLVAQLGVEAELVGLTIQGAGPGVVVESGARATLRGVDLEGNELAAVVARHTVGSRAVPRVELDGCVARATRPTPGDQEGGFGLAALHGGAVVASRTLVDGNRDVGVFASGASPSREGSRVELRDCVVQGTLPHAGTAQGGFGLFAEEGGVVVAARTLLQANRSAGAFAGGEGPSGPSRIELEACSVRDTLARQSDQRQGYGAVAQAGATLTAARTEFRGNRSAGALSTGTGAAPSRVELTECVVRDTQLLSTYPFGGDGVSAQRGGALVAARSLLLGNRGAGALSATGTSGGPTARLHLVECAVRETRVALVAVQGGRLSASRVLVTRATEGSVMAAGFGTAIDLSEVIVQEPVATGSRGALGLLLAGGAEAEARQVAIVGSRGAALTVLSASRLLGAGPGARLTARDLFVQRVSQGSLDFDPCDPERAVGPARAYGLYVGVGTSVAFERALLRDGEVAVAVFGGAFTWTDGALSGFQRYLVRGTSVVTPPFGIERVAGPGAAALVPVEDPSLSEERLTVPDLDPAQPTPTCRGGP
ncbi:MAG: DUF1565 domain-containing protein [Deltaproteobacteria bacterium]|nr:DUF1565 domain-containing protein [Deltaproteobacteria bacterium]